VPASDPVAAVGRYRLVSKVGEGGMGVVYLGQDPAGHQVAVKLLRPHVVSDESGRARMAREVTSLRRVRSPLVAEVYDADPWGHTPYLVTRYVAGPSLHDRVESGGPLTGMHLEAVAGGLAQALVAVHAADVLHRDVKPSNVLLEGQAPVLIDFGLAQLADDSRLTHSGWLLGTPGYLAPEILFGDDPTPLADVHSWAATVVYAATGRGPYGNGPAVAVMDRVRRGEHDLSGVPDALYWVIRQSLSADPRDRPSSWQLADWLLGSLVGATRLATDRAHPAMLSPPTARTTTWPGESAGNPAGSGPASAAAPPAQLRTTPPSPFQPAQSVQSVAPAAQRPATQDSAASPGQPQSWPAAAAHTGSGPAWPAARRRPRAALAALFWFGVSCLVMAAAVTAPGVTAFALIGASWLLRTTSVRANRLTAWRLRRGPRRNDSVLATMCTPWFSVVAAPGTVINAGFALAGAAVVVTMATLAMPPRTLVYVLALGGFAASVLLWCGPGGRGVRAGGRTVSAVLLQPGLTTVLVLLAIASAAVAVLLTRQVAGAFYAPFPLPPWQHGIREFLPHG
jgi:serine/threonine protein kinase